MTDWKLRDWIAVALLTLLAAALRLYGLGNVPPGFQFDEAFNAVDAQQVLAGNRPLFLPANAGREALYTYWQALLIDLFGMRVYTLRLASAIFGVIAVPLTYLLLRLMLRRDSRSVALFTSVTLAISLWHIHFSHYGIRVIMMPVVFSLAFGAYWHAGQHGRRNMRMILYVVSGLFIGLSVWTHPTGRLAPFVVILYTVWLLWQRPHAPILSISGPVAGLALTGVTAFVVFLPLGLEFLSHPEFFTGHASEVSVFAERVSGDSPLMTLGKNVLRVLGMFAFRGDMGWTHNVAGRPVFDVLMAVVFTLGLAIWAVRIFRSRKTKASTVSKETDGDALVILALWAAIMLTPSVFSEAAPNYSRTLPALPALFVAAGLGLTRVAAIERPWRFVGAVGATVVILYSGVSTVYDYFVIFPHHEDVYYLYDADKLDALDVLAEYTDDYNVYLSQIWGDHHATVAMLRRDLGVKSLDTSDALVLPPPGKGAVYAFPSEQLERAEQVAALWPGVEVRSSPDDFGNVLLHIVETPADIAAQIPAKYATFVPVEAQFERAPNLIGLFADTPDKQVTLLWSADEAMDASLTSYMHLIDADGRRVAQIDKLPGNGSYRTEEWEIGEVVLDRYYPAMIDPCAAGVPLRAQVGWYAREEGHVSRMRSDAAGETALAGTVVLPILSHDPGYLRPQIEASDVITAGLTFRGSNFVATDRQPGSTITVDLYWRSDHEKGSSPIFASQGITMSLTSEDDAYSVWSGELAPESDWDPGEEICRRIQTQIPVHIPAGTYELGVKIGDADGDIGFIELRTFDVPEASRLFEPPPLQVETHARLIDERSGDEIELLGIESTSIDDGVVDLRFAWQAVTSPQGNYRVFVHLVDEDGQIVSQSDATPGDDYPTNRWLEGEVVLDMHQLELPADGLGQDYRILAGMYDPISAVRLAVYDSTSVRLPSDSVVLAFPK